MPIIEVQDFGPIAKASIDLKPLTVFMGSNNTGKSYLALAVYSLSRTLRQETPVRGVPGFGTFRRSFEVQLPPELVKKAASAIKKIPLETTALGRGPLKLRKLPDPVQELVKLAMKSYGESLNIAFGSELQRCFGTRVSGLGRLSSGVEQAGFSLTVSDPSLGLNWQMRSNQEEMVTSRWESQVPDIDLKLGRTFPPREFLRREPEMYIRYLVREVAEEYYFGLAARMHYLPASRSGIMLGHKTLTSSIVDRASLAWLEPLGISTLPGVITDLIRAPLLLRKDPQPSSKIQNVISFLEGDVMQGTVDVDRSLPYPEILYDQEGHRFHLHQASSMVAEVAPLVLFLKYLVQSGDLLIVEEPESHLDPDSQRNVARALAMLVNSGVKVLLTTHSDYFINQLNNLLLLSDVSSRKRLRRGYKAGWIC